MAKRFLGLKDVLVLYTWCEQVADTLTTSASPYVLIQRTDPTTSGATDSISTKKAGRLEMSNSTNFSSFRGHLGAKMEGERAFVGISGISDKRPACASVVCLRPVSGATQRLFVTLFIVAEHKKCEQKRG